jgi:hypothetical protein
MSGEIQGSTYWMALARLAEQLFIHGLLAQFEADCLLYLGLEF